MPGWEARTKLPGVDPPHPSFYAGWREPVRGTGSGVRCLPRGVMYLPQPGCTGSPEDPQLPAPGGAGGPVLLSLGIALEERGSRATPRRISSPPTPPFSSPRPSAQAVKINLARPPLRGAGAWLAPKLHPQNAGAEGPDLGEVRRGGGRAHE